MLSYDLRVSSLEAWEQELKLALDQAYRKFSVVPSPNIIDRLAIELGAMFDLALAEGRVETFKSICKSHPLAKFVLEDPYARRACEKPRGYAGDAVMLDYIYRPQAVTASPIGMAIHAATTGLSSAESILWRRDYLARQITSAMAQATPTRVLAVASGHMRELDLVDLPKSRDDLEICAVDLDMLSLEECVRSYPGVNIRPLHSSAVTIRRAKLPQHFDLVYCAGLFDYLNDATAEFVLAQLFHQVRPSGLLCVANFTPDNHGRGFMEGLMDWSLILRDEVEFVRLAKSAAPTCADVSAFRDPMRNIAYLEMRKA
jgi:SAM-dependent methyltransferase